MPRPPLLAVVLLSLLLGACSMQKLARMLTPSADLPLVHALFTAAREGNTATERSQFAVGAEPSSATLRKLHRLLSNDGKPELVGIHVSKSSHGFTRTRFQYQFGHDKHTYRVVLRIGGPDNQRRIRDIVIGPSVDIAAMWHNVKPVLVTMAMIALLLLAGIIVVAVWLVRRDKHHAS